MASDERLGEVTVLLQKWKAGDTGAVDEILPLVYEELRALARASMSRERPGHTLSSTGLVHEAYLRLSRVATLDAKDRSHFLTLAARTMRRVLVDHARSQFAEKRVGAHLRQPLQEEGDLEAPTPETVVAINDLLDDLKAVNPRAAELVELRFFGGLSEGEAAEVLEVSRSSTTRDWRFARLWLFKRLQDR